MMSKEDQRRMDENFAFIEHVLERDLGINLHPEMPVYESNETKEELEAWIEEQVYGPEEEKWNDVAVDESVKLIPVESVRSMIESGEMDWDEDGDGFEDEIANRIQDELFDYLDDCDYFIANKDGNETEITRYTLNGWYSLRPDEFKYYRGGMEWDYIAYAYWYLMRNYSRLKKHAFLILHIDENGPVSYPFMIYQVGKKWYHHESAFKDNIIHEEFDSPAEAVEAIMNRWKEKTHYTDGITKIAEYTPWDHYEQKFDEFYVSIFEDYRNWLKKYAKNFFIESMGYDPFTEGRRRTQRSRRKPLDVAYHTAWDYQTGHQIQVIYDFNNNVEITDVGRSYYLVDHPDNDGKDPNQAREEYSKDVRDNVRMNGSFDFESKNHVVKAIKDIVTGKYINRPVKLIPPFPADLKNWSHILDFSKYPKRFEVLRYVVDHTPGLQFTIKKGEVDPIPRFKSTHWPKIPKDETGIQVRWSKIQNMEREKSGRGVTAEKIANSGIKAKKNYQDMTRREVVYELQTRLKAITDRRIDIKKIYRKTKDPVLKKKLKMELIELKRMEDQINHDGNELNKSSGDNFDKSFLKKYREYDAKKVTGLKESALFVEEMDQGSMEHFTQIQFPTKGEALKELFIRRNDISFAVERGEFEYPGELSTLKDDIWYIINEGYDPSIMMKYGSRDDHSPFKSIYLTSPCNIYRHYGSFSEMVSRLPLDLMDISELNLISEEYMMSKDQGKIMYPESVEYRALVEKYKEMSKETYVPSNHMVDDRFEVPFHEDTQSEEKGVNKNGVNRKNLYIAFIQYAQRVDTANKFDTNFTKDIFDKKYKNVPESMRYFYRLADPTQCILNDNLVFFSLKNAQDINKKNSDITKYYIFAGIGDLFYVVDQNNGAVYEATEEQLRHVKVGKKMAPNFDIYIQKLVNNGDYLDGKVVPPDDRPKKEDEKKNE